MTALAPEDDFHAESTTLLHQPLAQLGHGFSLRLASGPGAGATFVIDASACTPALIGSSALSAMICPDPGVSRRHLSVETSGDYLRLKDLDSTNGTRVNGVLVKEALLVGGERVELGNSTIDVERARVTRLSPPPADRFGRLIGASDCMRRLYPLCQRLATASVPVVIEGETGTGKEVLAESLHEEGPRAGAPFVVFDCTAVPPSLLESALFGHERGAFTGATEARPGVFEDAHGGTLLIDEIGELELGLQATLLRAIERGEVRRIGGKRWLKVDVRVLAATRRDLDRLVAEGRFRDDLYFRLGVARVELPPLRQRTGDVRLLAQHFWALHSPGSLAPAEFLDKLEDYAFPGNVRELSNVVARRIALGDFAPNTGIRLRVPPNGDFIDGVLGEGLELPVARQRVVQELEQRYVKRALEKTGGNVTEAAKSAGVARRYFQLLRARLGRGGSEAR